MKYFLLLCICTIQIGCLSSNANSQISQVDKLVADFTKQIENDVQDDHIVGCLSMAILEHDRILAHHNFGYKDPLNKTRADANTIYRIGSITKSFTGFLLLKMAQDGLLDIDDPIEKHLPEIKNLVDYDNFPVITFKQLASHCAGLDRESRNRDVNIGVVSGWEDKVIKAIPETRFRSAPNERFGYSNIGYAILGLAISRAAETSYTDLISKHILDPLQMTNTFFEILEERKSDVAVGMAGGPTAEIDYDLPRREQDGRGYRVPNGGLFSNSGDMIKFVQACMGVTDLLDEQHLALLYTSQTPTNRLRSNYSIGFDLYDDQGIKTAGHGGSTPGYSAHFEFDLDAKFAIILMRNYNFGNTALDLRSNALLRKLSTAKQ